MNEPYVAWFTRLELRVDEAAQVNGDEWRWASWASHPRNAHDVIEVRPIGSTVWSLTTPHEYLQFTNTTNRRSTK